MRKVKWSIKYLLLIPIFIIVLVVANFIPFLLPVVTAGKPITMEQKLHAFLNSSSVPILTNRARLGMVFTGHPEIHKVYRARREELLERVAHSQPERQIIAVISLNDFYSPEEMPNIIDPAKFNIIGVRGRTPRGKPGSGNFGIGSGLGIASWSIPRYDLPPVSSLEPIIKNWKDFHNPAIDGLAETKGMLDVQQEAMRIIKAGQIPPEELQIFSVIVYDDICYLCEDICYLCESIVNDPRVILMEDIVQNSTIIAMTPKERLQNEEWHSLINAAKSCVERTMLMIKDWELIIQTTKVFGVVVTGPAAKINELRLRPEISIVDPALFPGIFGTISEGRRDLVLEFQPALPDAYLDD